MGFWGKTKNRVNDALDVDRMRELASGSSGGRSSALAKLRARIEELEKELEESKGVIRRLKKPR